MPIAPDLEKLMQSLVEIKNLLAEMNKYRFAEQYLNNEEFCSLFKISAKTSQLWRESGQIPFAQLGKKIYYRLSDIEALFEKEFNRPKHLKKSKSLVRKRAKSKPGNNGWTIRI